jgi:hypothetical protein
MPPQMTAGRNMRSGAVGALGRKSPAIGNDVQSGKQMRQNTVNAGAQATGSNGNSGAQVTGSSANSGAQATDSDGNTGTQAGGTEIQFTENRRSVENPADTEAKTPETVNIGTTVTENGKDNGTQVNITVNGNPLTLSGKDDYIFVDVFDRIDFDLTKPQGKTVETIINGRKAQYMEPLSDGDVLEIFWKD